MSAVIVDMTCPWQQVHDAIERAEELILEVPAWIEHFDDFELAPETDQDLREAGALVQRALGYLRSAAAREGPRLEAIIADCEARGVQPPWEGS